MITINRWAYDCLKRFRCHFHIKETSGTKIYSVLLSSEWRRMDEALDKAREYEVTSERQKSKYLYEARERLADMIVYCIGLLHLLGVSDVEDLVRKRMGK